MSLARSSLAVGAAAAASRVLGFVRDVLLAQTIGAGPAADAFLAAFRALDVIRRLMSEGGLNPVLIPALARLEDRVAARFTGEALAGLGIALFALLTLVELAAGLLMLSLAPGLGSDPAALSLATLYARIAWPLAAFATLASVVAAAMNARGFFAAAALAPLVVNAGLIGALIIVPRAVPDVARQAGWFAATLTLTGALQFAILLVAAGKARIVRWQRPRFAGRLRRLALDGVPVVVAGLMTPLFSVVAFQAASFTPAGVSRLYYADRLAQLPVSIIGAIVAAVLLPELARRLLAGERDAAVEAQNLSLAMSVLIALPAAVGLTVLAGPLAAILFERGAFGGDDTAGTASALSGLALGLPFAVAAKVLAQTCFARGDTRAVLRAGFGGLLTAFCAALILGRFAGLFGIGLGVAAGNLCHAALLGLAVRRGGLWRVDATLLRRLLGTVLASLALAGALLLLPAPRGAISLLATCIAAAIFYFGAAWLLGAVTRAEIALLAKKP
jgi:putative peptidoglycan lipid II flippase